MLGAPALVFVVLFALALSGRVRAKGASGWLANGAAVGAALLAAGFLPLFTFSLILGNDIKFLLPASAQALNVLNNDYFLPAVAGVVIFGIVTGLAVAVSGAPARWMGWVLFALGVAALFPPLRVRLPGHDALGPGHRDLAGHAEARTAGPERCA